MRTIIPTSTPLPATIDPCPLTPRSGTVTTDHYDAPPEGGTPNLVPNNVAPRHRATGAITSEERQHLARIARKAWEKTGAKGAGIPFDEWRHDQVAIATEDRAPGISKLRRGQYRGVKAHFLALAGDSAGAYRQATRSGQDHADRDLAIAKLKEACASGGLAFPEYPEAICRRQNRCGLDDLAAGKIWHLIYTCTNRARAKRKKATESPSDEPGEKSAVSTQE